MRYRVCLRLTVVAVLAALAGCAENKFTQRNYEMIVEGKSNKLEVENTLGKPAADRGEEWTYYDEDKSIHAAIYFNENGVVQRKEWVDGKTGTWTGAAPHIDESPHGRKAEESSSGTAIKK